MAARVAETTPSEKREGRLMHFQNLCAALVVVLMVLAVPAFADLAAHFLGGAR